MIGVVIDHDLIGIPQPTIAKCKFEWRHREVEAAKPEAVRPSPLQAKHMSRPEAAGKVAMWKRVIEMEARVLRTGVPDPLVVAGVNVWSTGVTGRFRMRSGRGTAPYCRCGPMCRNVPPSDFALLERECRYRRKQQCESENGDDWSHNSAIVPLGIPPLQSNKFPKSAKSHLVTWDLAQIQLDTEKHSHLQMPSTRIARRQSDPRASPVAPESRIPELPRPRAPQPPTQT